MRLDPTFLLPLFTAGLLVTGCGPADELDEQAEASFEEEQAPLSATFRGQRLELSAAGPSARRLVLKGAAATTVTSAFAFVPDDRIGEASVARTTFKLTFSPSEM